MSVRQAVRTAGLSLVLWLGKLLRVQWVHLPGSTQQDMGYVENKEQMPLLLLVGGHVPLNGC